MTGQSQIINHTVTHTHWLHAIDLNGLPDVAVLFYEHEYRPRAGSPGEPALHLFENVR